ncbi:MAG: sensor domain-containing diguanylate cyclase [Myxococcota bacterium]|jgi:diguanylate cyclase (GGDEF)-like protein|nr:sensor domain-containing diguanylate cyclase [Myxococcota bacterium]
MTRSRPKLLLVSEDATVRDVVSRATTSLAPLEICSGVDEAFERLSNDSEIRVVLYDSHAQGMAPWQVAERLRRAHSGVELALLIGEDHGDDGALREGGLLGVVPRLAGPGTVRTSVASVLDRYAQARELRVLRTSARVHEQCRRLTPCLEPGRVYPVALDIALEVTARPRGVAIFQREALPMSDAIAFRGLGEGEAERLRELLLNEKPLAGSISSNIEVVDSGPHVDLLRRAGTAFECLLVVPLQGQHSEVGMLWLIEDGRPFDDEEIDRIRTVASYAGGALDNCERYQNAKERAFIDDVTEAYNARYLLATTEKEIRRAERYEKSLSVVFLDLDRFKLVNDNHGHLVGSQVLRNLSQLLAQCVRDVDTLARYGGDEFTILLVDTDHTAAMAIAERIRRSVESHVFEAGRGGSLRLTVSLGVGTYPEHGTDRTTLLDTADKAMYRSKSLGRNQTSSANDLTSG